jgi:predicted dehydrogenase
MKRLLPIRVGLIGLGRHGTRYALHLLQDIPEGRLIAVARRNIVHGLPFPAPVPLALFDDPLRLIADDRVAAVVAVVPPAFNHPICLAAAAARKPLLVEKPMAPTAAVAREMADVMDLSAVPFMVAHTLRFNGAILAFRDKLSNVGSLKQFSLTLTVPPRPRPPGNPGFLGRGPLLDLGVHLLDLTRWLVGPPAHTISCETKPDPTGEMEATALVEFQTEQGCDCALRVGWEGTTAVGRGEAVGSEGCIQVDWIAHQLQEATQGVAPFTQAVTPEPTLVPMLHAYLNALAEDTPMPISSRDGFEAVQLVDACYDSAARRTPVRIEPH